MRRRKARRRRLIIGTAAAVVIIAAGSTLIYWNLPQTKLGRALEAAKAYMTEMDYVNAQEAYETALSIDDTSVQAYRGLADDFTARGMEQEAESILLEGYEVTGDSVLLQNYAATVLNDAVEQINSGNVTYVTAQRCLDVLEKVPAETQAADLLTTCAQRLLQTGDQSFVLLDGLDGSSGFPEYQDFADRLLTAAQGNPALYLPAVEAFCVIPVQEVYLSLSHAADYRALLERAEALGAAGAGELLACLDKQSEISAYFAPMFENFERGNFEAAKSFIVGDEYKVIRDSFIEGVMDYWYGYSYVPVTKEAIVFLQTENGRMFSYVEDSNLVDPTGTIRVLGQTMKDMGVQRTGIEYVPAYDPAFYYPHTEYEIIYWNTMVTGDATVHSTVVSRMNYRFAEKIFLADRTESNMIYDWGGPNEKRKKE